jgi:DNA-binding MarR family transcriptional regulator
MGTNNYQERDLVILERIERDPDETQASMATQLGVAVGTINWHIKRLIEKGYIKVRRAERRKLRYIITPEGVALRAKLTVDFIQTSFQMYRLVRDRVSEALEQVRTAGYSQVQVQGEGDVADVCLLSCLEKGVTISEVSETAPLLNIQGLKIHIVWPDDQESESKLQGI